MKKIIVPTDFSQQAGFALDFACEIGKKADSQVTLMHVIEYAKKQTTFLGSSSMNTMGSLTTGIEMDDIYFIELFKRRKSQMAEVLGDPKYKGVKLNDKIMLGSPYHAIAEEIAEQNADLIIMGTTGVSNWEESLIGSLAEKVVRHAACPVLTLRSPVHLNDIKTIVFASDFKEKLPNYIPVIKRLQDFFEAEIHLVYINTPSHFVNQREILKTITAFAEENGFQRYQKHIYSHQHEEEGIVGFTEDFKMNMIIMTTAGRTGLSRIFEHSIAEDVVNFSKKPVVTINIQHVE